MEVGDLGVPTLPAARLVEEALRQNLDNATILPHHTEGPSVQDHLLRDRTVTLKLTLDGRWGSWGSIPRYSNWDVGEPNNHKHRGGDDEDCLLTNWDGEMVGHTRWNDAPCSNPEYQFGFICQKKPCHIERC